MTSLSFKKQNKKCFWFTFEKNIKKMYNIEEVYKEMLLNDNFLRIFFGIFMDADCPKWPIFQKGWNKKKNTMYVSVLFNNVFFQFV